VTPLAEAEGGRSQILACELFGGWEVRVWRRENDRYDATIAPPGHVEPTWQLALWPGLERLVESMAAHIGPRIRLSPAYVRSVLVALLDQETHP
jgi:hypothetical protein